ncbi:MAG: acyltransferase [Renibacterium sp.]|nr:acyltransferase [Renibacterium sp.]
MRLKRVASMKGFRPEIQGLRTIAVLGVVIYHIWPGVLPGGFVGVDVFFVISGYLIMSHLLRDIEQNNGLSLGRFWARRARRLIPASVLVVLISYLATLLWVPQFFWRQFSAEYIASILYFQNWALSANSVDYLARGNIASPVEHYWSLSVEEQFYIVLPLILVLLLTVFRPGKLKRARLILFVIGSISLVSLVFSITQTVTDPSAAYFSTLGRAWEFGAGAILACLFKAERRLQSAQRLVIPVRAVGLAMIAISLFGYSAQTPFPGVSALLPVLGTALVILAGGRSPSVFADRILDNRPMRFIGDISYSVYLWHWPLLILLPYVFGAALTFAQQILVLFLSLALGYATKRFVEDPLRRPKAFFNRKTWRTLVATVLVMMLTVTGITVSQASLLYAPDNSDRVAVEINRGCLGAAFRDNADCSGLTGIYPSLADLSTDTGNAYDCWSEKNGPMSSCSYGRPGATKVAVAGDSHAAMLLPGLTSQAAAAAWQIDTYVGWGCQLTTLYKQECQQAGPQIQEKLLNGGYSVVITTASRAVYPDVPFRERVDSYKAAWAPLIEAGIKIIVIEDNPLPSAESSKCVISSKSDPAALQSCSTPIAEATSVEDTISVAAKEQNLPWVPTKDLFCDSKSCPSEINRALVYNDESHITATFSRTAGPKLLERIQQVLKR